MNVTSRIEDITAAGEILAADSTLRSLKGFSQRCQPGDQRQGINQSIVVHQILAAAP